MMTPDRENAEKRSEQNTVFFTVFQLCLIRPLWGTVIIRTQKVRITEIRITKVFHQGIFEGPEHFIRISKSSNYASSN